MISKCLTKKCTLKQELIMKEKYIKMPAHEIRRMWDCYIRSKNQMEQTPYYIPIDEREAMVDALITRVDKMNSYVIRLEKTISLLSSHVEERIKNLES